MSAPDRQSAYNVTVFNIGGTDLLATLENATWKGDVKHVEAKGISDTYRYPWAVDGGWDLEGDLFAATHSLTMNLIGTSVSVSYTVGGTSYTGTALVTSGSHMAHNADIQKQKVSLIGQGAPVIA